MLLLSAKVATLGSCLVPRPFGRSLGTFARAIFLTRSDRTREPCFLGRSTREAYMQSQTPPPTLRQKLGEAGALLAIVALLVLPTAMTSCGTDAATSSTTAGNTNATGSTITTPTTSAAACVVQSAPTCADPNAAPSYSGKVANVIYSYCLQCHDPNGIANIGGSSHEFRPPPGGYGGNANDANRPTMGNPNGMPGDSNRGMGGNGNRADWDGRAEYDWSSYPNIRRHARDMINVITKCVMPPSQGTPLNDADRDTLLQWLVCGAPDN